MSEVIITDSPAFQLCFKKIECQNPKGIYAVYFIQLTKDQAGNVTNTSTYEFFMNQSELTRLSKALIE